ncbi:MAG: AraC family transcriptional regulator [Clostridia bacterium]|nr:AraC family transcriptional regulator [Clostridia bacterium]
MKIIFLNNRNFKDLNPLQLGYEECKPLKRSAHDGYPRCFTTIHYVFSGKGKLFKNGKEYEIGAGNLFIIMESEAASYIADKDDPWSYAWILFDGERSGDFARLPTVLPYPPDIFHEMLAIEHSDMTKESLATALLFRLHADIKQKDRLIDEYVSKIINIINANYMYDMTVEKIAGEMNLNRHYISSVFKKETGKSIQEYLIFVRMSAAKKYLELGKGVTETAMLCGYTDSSTFSKMFKKYCEFPPSKYKEKHDYYTIENIRRKSIIIDI